MKFKRLSNPGIRAKREPSAGDFKYPVTLARSERNPTEEGGLKMTLEVYLDTFATFEPAQEKRNRGENLDVEFSHIFSIRNIPTISVEVRDYVIYRGRFYKVNGTRLRGRYLDNLAIYAAEHFESSSNVDFEVIPLKGELPLTNEETTSTYWNLPSE